MRSIRIIAKNMGYPYYEPTIVVHDTVGLLRKVHYIKLVQL